MVHHMTIYLYARGQSIDSTVETLQSNYLTFMPCSIVHAVHARRKPHARLSRCVLDKSGDAARPSPRLALLRRRSWMSEPVSKWRVLTYRITLG